MSANFYKMAFKVFVCLYFILVIWINGFHASKSNLTFGIIPGCENNNELNNCMGKFLPNDIDGIPSNLEETQNTCRVFGSSMACVQQYMRKCKFDRLLEEVLNASVNPTIEMYTKICKDERSMAAFYKFGACHKKATPGYLKCSDRYEQVRGGLTNAKNTFEICCHHINFLSCVDKVIRLVCTPDSYNNVINLTKEAVQHSRAEIEGKKECSMVNFIRCPNFSGVGNILNPYLLIEFVSLIYLRLSLYIWQNY